MPKLQRVEDDAPEFEVTIATETPEDEGQESSTDWKELEDGSREIFLSPRFGSKRVVLREMLGEDIEAMDHMPEGQAGKIIRLTTRLCIKWGDKSGVTVDQLKRLPAKEMLRITQMAESFLL